MSKGVPQLRSLFWEATLRCNAACWFCGSGCEPKGGQEVEADVVYRAFESVAQAYDPHRIMVNVTGGEPLLRKDLFNVMGKVHELGFPWGMVTNASLIDSQVIQLMKDTGMRTISVSLDGLGEKHEKTRRLPGAFPRIVEAIRKLGQKSFLDAIQVTTVVTRDNVDCLNDMLAYFRQLPLDSWRLALVDPIGRCRDRQELALGADDLQKYFFFMNQHRFNAAPVIVTSCSHYLGEKDTLYRSHPFSCEAGRSVASILADGSIFVCPNVPRDCGHIQGNIHDDNLAEVWETGFRWFRDDSIRKTGQCASCESWDCCKGDSLHTWDFEREAPNFCIRRLTDAKKENGEVQVSSRSSVLGEFEHLKRIKLSYGSSSNRLVQFSLQATRELYDYFHWGQKHPVNVYEQMVAAVGYFYEARAWVEELIPVPLVERGQVTARMDEDAHSYIMREIGVMNRGAVLCEGYEAPFHLIGYIHSHPCELNATMSLPDLEFASWLDGQGRDSCFLGIINPQKRDLCIYWDSAFSPCGVELCAEGQDIGRWL